MRSPFHSGTGVWGVIARPNRDLGSDREKVLRQPAGHDHHRVEVQQLIAHHAFTAATGVRIP
jgi:hypothetical protein